MSMENILFYIITELIPLLLKYNSHKLSFFKISWIKTKRFDGIIHGFFKEIANISLSQMWRSCYLHNDSFAA